jgi:hypothetical protein
MTVKSSVSFAYNDTAIADAFAVAGANTVRIGVMKDKVMKYVASATLYPRGFSVRVNRGVTHRELNVADATAELTKIAMGLGVKAEDMSIVALIRDAKLKPEAATSTVETKASDSEAKAA